MEKINSDKIYRLCLLYKAGFATKKMMSSVTIKEAEKHIEKLINSGADYNDIKRILLKDINAA